MQCTDTQCLRGCVIPTWPLTVAGGVSALFAPLSCSSLYSSSSCACMRLTDDECECMLLVDVERLNEPDECSVGVAEAAATPPCVGGMAALPPSPLSAGEDAAERSVGVTEEKCTRGSGAPAVLDTDDAAVAWGFVDDDDAAAAAVAPPFAAAYAGLLSAGDELYVPPACVVCPFVCTVHAGIAAAG